jgi:hypothetical protein
MRFVLALLLVALSAPLAGAATVRSVTAPAPVLALAHDGSSVAYAVGRNARDCDRVYVWNLATRGVTKLGRRTHCVETSTGNAISALGVAGTRVLWLHYAGGNRRNYTLWTATTSRPLPRLLASREVDVDDPAPIVVGRGDHSKLGSLLPYAAGAAVVALRADGSRALAWTAPAPVVALAAHAGELAVAYRGGRVAVLDARGRVERTETFASEVDAVALTGRGLVVQRGRTVELRGGAVPRLWELPRSSRLRDATGDWAYFVDGGTLHRLRLTADGTTQYLTGGTDLDVESSLLATASGRRVFVQPLPR